MSKVTPCAQILKWQWLYLCLFSIHDICLFHFSSLQDENDNDDDGIPTDSNTTPTRFMLESTNGVTMKSFKKSLYSSVSPGSFDGLDDDGEGDVAYIDDDVDERDLHGDLLNWLTLSDAPRQGHNEHDL